MANLFTILFRKSKLKELEQTNETLKAALEECSSKLIEKQEHINTTNAYWKKKMREAKTSKPRKPREPKSGSEG